MAPGAPEPVLAVSPAVRRIGEACARAGGRALLVGGFVRDALRGVPDKDVDIEVHGVPLDALVDALRPLGRLNEVGRSFGVLKLRLHGTDPDTEPEVDVSLPRRDSREGTGHRGIRATADPFLGVVEAARRRDLTINAIAYDPLTGAWEDPFHGREDLAAGVLRAVDAATFGEDPLRALRVAQFAARFGFRVDPELEALCAAMPLHELPAERVRGEVEKLLLRAARPSLGWGFAERVGAWAKVLPEWGACPPDLDRCAGEPVEGVSRRLSVMLACACVGLDDAAVERVLDRLWIHRERGYNVRAQVRFLARRRAVAEGPVDAPTCRRLADEGEIELLARLAGNPDLLALAGSLGVSRGPLPPLLGGRDLRRFGLSQGPEMGRLLGLVREEQLEGRLTDREQALEWVRARMEGERSP